MTISAALLPFIALFALAQSPVDIRLSPERVTVRPGKPLELVLTITNRSGRPVGLITPNLQNVGQRPYYFEHLSSRGEVLEVESREFPIGQNETMFPGVSVIEAGGSFKQGLTVNGFDCAITPRELPAAHIWLHTSDRNISMNAARISKIGSGCLKGSSSPTMLPSS